MKHRLPILPAIALGALAAIGAGMLAVHARDGAKVEQTPEPIRTALTPAPRAGDLVEQALRQLASHQTVAAAINLTSSVFGESLVASGQYLQGPKDSRRLRMELKVQLGEKVCSLQQISDGQALWIRRTTITQSFLGRVDVPRALVALQQADLRPTVEGLALGGLPLLLDSLYRGVEFRAARTDRLGAMPVMVISGTWKPSLLVHFLPDQREAIEAGTPADLGRMPAYAPNEVEVFLGRDDLFPYKIDFLHSRTPGTRASGDRVLASIKFVDVKIDAPIEASQFIYQPGEIVPIDETAAFVGRMMVH
jgi:hypothetical protein